MACCFLEVVKRGERETVARRGAAIEQNPVSRGRNQVHYPPLLLLLLLLPLHRKREATCQCGGCPPAQPSPAHATVAGPIKLDRQMFCHQSQRTGWAGLGWAGILPHISSKHLISPAQTADCTTACTLVLRTRLLLNNAVPSSAQPIPRLTNNASLLQDS